jgi:pyruvate formate lyase activating enzyme
MKRKLTKREFLRYSAMGIAATAVGSKVTDTFSNNMVNLKDSAFPSPVAGLWKWSRESPYYTVTAKGVRCRICPNNCILKEGQDSICRTHMVKDDKLYTIAYGNPCSVHIDPIEKKPLFHFLPTTRAYSIATAGCTLACLNCQNWEISQESPRKTQNADLMPLQVVEEAVNSHCQSIAYTYSEPIAFYEYTYDTARLARARGLKNLLISNGYVNEQPIRDLCKYIDAANINLKSFTEETYEKLNGGALQPILDTLKIIKQEGVWLEITNLIVPNWTDKMDMIIQMCNWLVSNGFSDSPLHFLRFFPLYKLTTLPYTPESVLEQARNIAMKAGMKYVYIGNVPGTTYENTYCPQCTKVVLERQGFAILQNNLKNSTCKFCGTKIAGIWE